MCAAPVIEVDIFDRARYTDGFPHELFAELRSRSPVHRQPWPASHQPYGLAVEQPDTLWHVFSHADVRAINRDWETFSARGGPTLVRGPEGAAGLLGLDPPEHHRLRHVVASAFTPRMIAGLEEQIDGRVRSLLKPLIGESFDFVEEFAYPLPMHVISDIIGIPESDRDFVFDRVQTLLDVLDPDSERDIDTHGAEIFAFAADLADEKRRRPADDVWSTIIASGLPDDDVNLFFIILSLAGSETTRNALTQGLVALVGAGALAGGGIDRELMSTTGTDEVLRFTSPVLTFARDVQCDVEVCGETLRAGDRLLMWHIVANRDPEVFTDPNRLDLERDPNPHVAFGGGGPHYCLGANLAKREIEATFTHLAAHHPGLEVLGEPVWTGPGPVSNVGCSISKLPVALR